MASNAPRTTRLRRRSDGKIYWVQHRTGFRGREFDAGGGWRPTLGEAFTVAEQAGELSPESAQWRCLVCRVFNPGGTDRCQCGRPKVAQDQE